MQAGILEDRRPDSGVRAAVLADPELAERQKQVLLEIYESFRRETAVQRAGGRRRRGGRPGPRPARCRHRPRGRGAWRAWARRARAACRAPGMGSTGGGPGPTGPTRRAPARKRRRTTQEGLPVQARESEIRNESHHGCQDRDAQACRQQARARRGRSRRARLGNAAGADRLAHQDGATRPRRARCPAARADTSAPPARGRRPSTTSWPSAGRRPSTGAAPARARAPRSTAGQAPEPSGPASPDPRATPGGSRQAAPPGTGPAARSRRIGARHDRGGSPGRWLSAHMVPGPDNLEGCSPLEL